MKGQSQTRAKGPDKNSESLKFAVGLVGLIVVLSAGVLIPLKIAEVMFGYSVSDAFWQVTETTRTDESKRTRR